MSIKIRFKGEVYWLVGTDTLDEPAAVAYLDHCDEGGCPTHAWLANPEPGFAYWNPDQGLLRHQTKIGDRADIEVLTH